jgi:hypothetical protein
MRITSAFMVLVNIMVKYLDTIHFQTSVADACGAHLSAYAAF